MSRLLAGVSFRIDTVPAPYIAPLNSLGRGIEIPVYPSADRTAPSMYRAYLGIPQSPPNLGSAFPSLILTP